jgi:hypothetical protein
VGEELALLRLAELAVGVDARRVLDVRLLDGHADVLADRARAAQRDEGLLRAEQPGVDEGPFGLAGLLVLVDVVDLADLVAVAIEHGPASEAVGLGQFGHIAPQNGYGTFVPQSGRSRPTYPPSRDP